MEAPYFGVPTVDVGTRQSRRATGEGVLRCAAQRSAIATLIDKALSMKLAPTTPFGDGQSAKRFIELLESDAVYQIAQQKSFHDRP